MRASSILLGVVVLHALASIAQQLARRAQEGDLQKALQWGGSSYLLVINGALSLLMALFLFSAWTRRRWALAPGLMVGLYLLAMGAWALIAQVTAPGQKDASSLSVTVFLQGPRLLIVLAAVVALISPPAAPSRRVERTPRDA